MVSAWCERLVVERSLPLSVTQCERSEAGETGGVEHGVELLRKVAADLDGARRRAAPLRERVRRDYAPPVVAGKLLAALDAV